MDPKRATWAALLGLILIAAPASAATGLYVSGNLGASFLSDGDYDTASGTVTAEYDTGYVLGAAFGHAYPAGFRAEVEISYRAHDVDRIKGFGSSTSSSGDISALAVLLNGYYDIRTQSRFTPFVGIGAGFASVSVEDMNIRGVGDDDDTVFAYQLAAGVECPLSPFTSLEISYRFFGTSDPDFGGVDAEYQSHNFQAGIRVYF